MSEGSGSEEESNHKESKRQAREGTLSGEGYSVDVAHSFIAPVNFDFRISVPLRKKRFSLRHRRLRCSEAVQGKEIKENDEDSW